MDLTDWIVVPDTSCRYYFNEYGLIYSVFSKRLLAVKKDKNGYHCAAFCVNGVLTYKKVHRLVAIHFVPNPENKNTVNHKDGNKLNNHYNNLEWATNSEQMQHASKMLNINHNTPKVIAASSANGIKRRIPIVALGADGRELWRAISCVHGSLEHGLVRGSVASALRNGRMLRGMYFKYLKDFLEPSKLNNT